jgi:peptide/nickel transport system substrate-binding protein
MRIQVTLVAVLLLSGCAGTDSAGQVFGAPAAYDIDPMPREGLKTGGTLRWPVPEFPAQWNLTQANGARGAVDLVMRGVLPYLMRSDELGVSHPDPDYLTGTKATRNTVTYTLNPKAAWSDGTPVTYRDLAAQAAALSGRDPRFQIASATGYDQIQKVVRGRDDRQAVVTFARPFADWAALFSPLYPARTDTDPAVFNRGWLNRLPETAGPFTLGAIDRTAKTITIVRDPRWWGRPAKLDAIAFRGMDAAAMPGAFANHEVDLLDIGADADAYTRVRRVKGTVMRRAGGPDWRQITFNTASPLLDDPRVRRAITLGIDRTAIAGADLKGLGWPVRVLGNHFFMNTQKGYRDNSGDLGAYDPGRARRLLDEAGWRLHGVVRAKGARTLALRLTVPSGAPAGRQEAEIIQAMLTEIGVRTEIRTVPVDDFFDRYASTGDFDLMPFSWLGNPFPVSSNQSIFALPRGGRIQQNFARAGSPQLDAQMSRAIEEPDPDKARALANAADRLVWQQASVLPLYQRPQLVACRADLANVGARGFYDLAYQDIGFSF